MYILIIYLFKGGKNVFYFMFSWPACCRNRFVAGAAEGKRGVPGLSASRRPRAPEAGERGCVWRDPTAPFLQLRAPHVDFSTAFSLPGFAATHRVGWRLVGVDLGAWFSPSRSSVPRGLGSSVLVQGRAPQPQQCPFCSCPRARVGNGPQEAPAPYQGIPSGHRC